MSAKGMPDARHILSFLSEDNMRLRDSIMQFIKEESRNAKKKKEDVSFRMLMDRAILRLNNPAQRSYYAIPQVVRVAIANKYAMLRTARAEKKALEEVHKHQAQLNFNPIKINDPPF